MAIQLRWTSSNVQYPESAVHVYRGQPTLEPDALPPPLASLPAAANVYEDAAVEYETDYQYIIGFERDGIIRLSSVISLQTLPESVVPITAEIREQSLYVVDGKPADNQILLSEQLLYVVDGKPANNQILLSEQSLYVVDQTGVTSMNTLFMSNNVSDWGGVPIANNNASYFDNTRVSTSVQVPDGTLSGQMVTPFSASTIDDTWLHCRFYRKGPKNGAEDGHMMPIRDGAGDLICRVDILNGEYAAVVYGDTTVTGAYGDYNAGGAMNDIDIKVVVTAASVTMELYSNQSLISTATAVNTIGGLGKPQFWDMDHVDAEYLNDSAYFSEFLVAEEDTRGARISRLDPTTAGDHTDLVGTISDLSDDDLATGLVSDASLERMANNHDTYAGGSSIAAAALVSHAQKSGTPSGVKQSLRISTTDYDASVQALGNAPARIMDAWTDDPSTALPWTIAGINAAQIGLQTTA